MFTTASTTSDKILQMFAAILLFAAAVGVILFAASRVAGKRDRAVAALYLLPTVLMLGVGLLYPGVRTVYQSFFDASLSNFIGLDNYTKIFTDAEQLTVLRNTAFWVLVTPFAATGIGLLYAILVDKARLESFAKALIFLPMSISFVAASVIWKFMYEYRPDQRNVQQIGLVNQVIVWLGGEPVQLLIESPLNTFLLIVVMIWIQAGFAMTVLAAAIKAIPDDIIEAARLDGVGPWGMFRFVTLPAIRPAVVVVMTTIAIGTLKVFDIVQTMTGGRFDTNVIANEFYSQSFRSNDKGLGSALAVVLFVLVIPIVVYNIRQLRRSEA
ncbi:alpha-glucoside transport system permease protein [Actinoplanes campanulatus]|uniref:Alpha-glucoside transport system permease protein n=2 Tax=Actinoplanes campanulatus TaxID=113559 RepID=A0A7W5AI75_9ACTN|nr:sugar ABC transporter permease [Actinoplanes campanulatus]MBB3096763.1 alpha-glucoside transport system permease protein [Actinoplanes campanulatus]GGN31092.1 alpha-glucoside ABC transporter permease [Actinoplanes campanulatus]GID37308.1 alpha-glucoside ABC transporter permease [Actinoplanes campanulatus]